MPLEPATRLGVYEVLGPLGAGGMGEVYRARDIRLGRDVAIKVLPEGVARDASRLARFEREARFLASLNHPGIAAVYGFEEAAGVPYIVMELVPGETLTAKLTTGALSLEESLSIARQIAEALEAAHEKGVIHRDLKPANIKVTPEGKAKVLDLGLAKAFDVKAPSDEDMSRSPTAVLEETRPGVILGTAEFMSPEQARGKAVDKRTDIWAFGCILYEMLSGRRAFTGETISDVMVAILTSEPKWSALPAATPPTIRELLQRCLQKDPARRLRDIGDAGLQIEEVLAGGPAAATVAARRPRRTVAAVAVAALLVAIAAAYLALRPLERSPGALTGKKYLAVLPFRDLSGQPDGQLVADGLAVTLSDLFSRVPDIQVVTPAVTTAASREIQDPYRFARHVGANMVVRGTIQREVDTIRITYEVLNVADGARLASGRLDGSASDLFKLQDRVFQSAVANLRLPAPPLDPSPPLGLEASAAQDRYLRALGNLQRYEKESSVDEAVRLLEALAGEKRDSGVIQAALARAYLYKFNLTSDRAWAERASAAGERALLLAPNRPEVNVTLGEIAARRGRFEESIAAFQRALAADPSSAAAVLGLAEALGAGGKAAESEAAYRRAIDLQPAYWGGYNKLGGFYFDQGQYARAAELYRRVVELTPDNALGWSNLGAAYQAMEQPDRARDSYRRSIALDPTGRAHSNLGVLEYSQGRFAEAARAFEKAVELAPRDYYYWVNLGDAYRWAPAERARAATAYKRAIALAGEELRTDPRNPRAHLALAVSFAKTGALEKARLHLRRALEAAPSDPRNMYEAAVIAHLSGRRDEALEWIRRARESGSSAAEFEQDPEFTSLRRNQQFREALKSL